MKSRIEAKIELSYHWNYDQEVDIPENHKEPLKKDAEDRIFEMVKDGYYQGELNTSVDELTYSGWWYYKKIE